MGHTRLLGQLIFVVKALLARASGTLPQVLLKAFRALALIFSFLQERLRSHFRPSAKDDGSRRPPRSSGGRDRALSQPNDCKSDETHFTTQTGNPTINGTTHEIIPLDSSISCSLHPYPYIHNDKSRSSLSVGVRAARSAHSQAVASHHASQSTHNLGRPGLGLEPSWRVRSPPAGDEEYTFTFKSPDQPSSPLSQYRSPVRGYSMSSPDLGSSAYQIMGGLDRQTSNTTTSPAQSIQILDPDEMSISEEDHKSSTLAKPQLFHQRIFPLPPDFFTRYEKVQYAEKKETELVIPSLTLDFKSKPDPPGWTPVLHPEGVLYWYHADKNVVTESDLHNREFLAQVTEDLITFEDFLTKHKIHLPPNITLAFELTKDGDRIITDYYYADHDKQTIFFLDEFDASKFKISQEVKGVTSLAHIQHELEAQYWVHVMLYPSTLPKVSEAVNELKDLLFHYIADTTSSAFSTSPYDADELSRLLSVAGSMKKISDTHQIGAASFISRTMHVLARQKFYNWYGVPQRRLYRDLSVHGTNNKRTWLIKSLSPFLFSAPDVHLSSLHKMWVDGIMHNAVWVKSIQKLNEEWQEFILYATVLLNANVAFLAIQSIDTQEGSYRSPVQIASYLSIVASIGSIVIGLLLVRQNRTRAHGTANDVCQFLNERTHPTLGLETLAILYSLPYAMLLWGMVSFLAAFAWHCFDLTNIATRTIMGAAWVIFAALVIWCVWMGWVRHEMEADEIPVGEDPAPNDVSSPEGKENAESIKGDDEKHLPEPSRPHSRLSAKSARSRVSRVSAVVPVGTGTKKRWNWNALAFWHPRRTSVDSESTQV